MNLFDKFFHTKNPTKMSFSSTALNGVFTPSTEQEIVRLLTTPQEESGETPLQRLWANVNSTLTPEQRSALFGLGLRTLTSVKAGSEA